MSALDAANWARTVGNLRGALEADKASESYNPLSKMNVTPTPTAVTQPKLIKQDIMEILGAHNLI